MAHDIKNPIGNAVMFSEIMYYELQEKKDESSETDKEFHSKMMGMAENIRLSVQSLLTQVDSWTTALRIKSKEYDVSHNAFDLIDCIEKAYEDHEMYFNKKGIKLSKKFAYEECVIVSDDFLVKNIFYNLFSMMLIYASQGDEIIVRVDMNDDFYDIMIEDKYEGNRENIIKRFEQGVNISDIDVPEAGILKPASYGMMFCGEALRILAANQKVAPAMNGGLLFTFRLPLA